MTIRPRIDAPSRKSGPSWGPSTRTAGSAGTQAIPRSTTAGPGTGTVVASGVPRWSVRRALFLTVDGVAAVSAVILTGGGTAAAVAFAGGTILVDLFDRFRAAQPYRKIRQAFALVSALECGDDPQGIEDAETLFRCDLRRRHFRR